MTFLQKLNNAQPPIDYKIDFVSQPPKSYIAATLGSYNEEADAFTELDGEALGVKEIWVDRSLGKFSLGSQCSSGVQVVVTPMLAVFVSDGNTTAVYDEIKKQWVIPDADVMRELYASRESQRCRSGSNDNENE